MEAVLVPPREYTLKQVAHTAVLDRRAGKQRASKLGSRVVTAAYRHLVAPFFERHQPSRAVFVHHTVPYLVRNTSPAVTAILGGVWFRKHGHGSYGAFMGEVMSVIRTAERPSSSLQRGLKTQRQREAVAVVVHLQSLADGPFPLPARELQLRLLLPTPITAWRILQRLVALELLQLVEPGISRPAASKLGVKAKAATYQLAGRS